MFYILSHCQAATLPIPILYNSLSIWLMALPWQQGLPESGAISHLASWLTLPYSSLAPMTYISTLPATFSLPSSWFLWNLNLKKQHLPVTATSYSCGIPLLSPIPLFFDFTEICSFPPFCQVTSDYFLCLLILLSHLPGTLQCETVLISYLLSFFQESLRKMRKIWPLCFVSLQIPVVQAQWSWYQSSNFA